MEALEGMNSPGTDRNLSTVEPATADIAGSKISGKRIADDSLDPGSKKLKSAPSKISPLKKAATSKGQQTMAAFFPKKLI